MNVGIGLRVRRLLVVPFAVLACSMLVACGGMGTPRGATTTIATGEVTADNDFIPANQNLGDCVSSLPRPDCGSPSQGGVHQYLTFAVLMLGMAFIGWRISVSVRKRDRTTNEPSTH